MIVEFYRTLSGKEPVREFLDSLPGKLASKAISKIELLKEYGYRLKEPDTKKVSDEIWEIRVKQSSNIVRIFYFFFDGDKAILTNGFVKKTNKTPIREIEKAKKYRKDYIDSKKYEKS